MLQTTKYLDHHSATQAKAAAGDERFRPNGFPSLLVGMARMSQGGLPASKQEALAPEPLRPARDLA